MGIKLRLVAIGLLSLAVGAMADYLQVNLYSDSYCGNYVDQFSVTDDYVSGYYYQYNGAYSFLVANCDVAEINGVCYASVGNSISDQSEAYDGGPGGNCVKYNGNDQYEWTLVMEGWEDGNTGDG